MNPASTGPFLYSSAMICSCCDGRLYERLPAGGDAESSSVTYCRKQRFKKETNINKEKQVKGHRGGTKVLVLGVGWRVAADALLHTLGRVLDAVAGRPGAVDVMLAGGDGVGPAACGQNQSESQSENQD